MAVLLTGGAGYIGSHCAKLLKQAGEDVILLDDLRKGHRRLAVAPLVEASISAAVLDDLFTRSSIDAVMHFAAFIEVGESVADPLKYYENNFGSAAVLAAAMLRHNVRQIVFSSTAAVYGEPQQVPIPETHPARPVNPYGKSKWMVEELLRDLERAAGLRSVSLRYFNAAGADPEGEIGEMHQPESHLIPRLMEMAWRGGGSMPVYGNDYPTPDGTCIRDYIHVTDLAQAHLLALRHLRQGGTATVFNAGTERGYSVIEVLDATRRITGRDVKADFCPRRPGDAARLVANSEKIRRELDWAPKFGLDDTIASAWQWRQKLGDSFRVVW